MSVSIVLPAWNEEPNITQAIAEAAASARRLFGDHEVIVVDDGSTDRTAELARRAASADARIRVLSHDENRGYGEALRTGFLASGLDFVFFTDADLQFDVAELHKFIPFAGSVDVIAGYRLNREDALHRRLLAYAWNRLVRAVFFVPVRDIDCAFKLFDRRILDAIDIESVGAMVNTELMVKLGRRGATVVEVGVRHRPRPAGKARGATPRVIATALVELTRMRRRIAAEAATE
jgi:glycosyltransferase involved in cell wall biosynthesis